LPSEKPDAALAVHSTIRRKLISIVLVGIATTILLVTLANSWREAARYSEVKTAEITGIAHVFASAVADAVAAKDRTAILKPLRAIGQIPSFSYARVDDLSGKVLADLGATVVLEESAELPVFLRSSLNVQVAVVKSGIEVGRLTVLVKTDDLRASLIEGLLTGLIAALLSGAMGVAIATRLQKRITDPLRKLTQTMFDVERTQNFEQIVDHSSDDETGVLINTFNHMLKQIRVRDDRLAQHREQLEHKVEERTHDLKIAKDTAEEANAAKSDLNQARACLPSSMTSSTSPRSNPGRWSWNALTSTHRRSWTMCSICSGTRPQPPGLIWPVMYRPTYHKPYLVILSG
jgi:two-component system sensor histidine kinase BarA